LAGSVAKVASLSGQNQSREKRVLLHIAVREECADLLVNVDVTAEEGAKGSACAIVSGWRVY
jgi:hypothetical protein